MKHKLCIVLCIVLVCSLFALPAEQLPAYEPYQEHEFPLWTYKLRRAETLFFGSMVITLPVASLLYSLAVNSNLITPPSGELNSFLIQGGIAAGLSLGISLADFIIGEVGNR